MEAAATPSTSSTSQRRRPRRSSPLGHQQTVEFVRLMVDLDYDGTRDGPYRRPNLHKESVLEKVREMLHRFGIVRENKQLQKRWSDLRLKEPDVLEAILKEIGDQGEGQPSRGRSMQRRYRDISSSSSPSPPTSLKSASARQTSSEDSHPAEFSPGTESADEAVEGMDVSMSSSAHVPTQVQLVEEKEEKEDDDDDDDDDDHLFVPRPVQAASSLDAQIAALTATGLDLRKRIVQATANFQCLGHQFIQAARNMEELYHLTRNFNSQIRHLSYHRASQTDAAPP